jgi:hypothetical protein
MTVAVTVLTPSFGARLLVPLSGELFFTVGAEVSPGDLLERFEGPGRAGRGVALKEMVFLAASSNKLGSSTLRRTTARLDGDSESKPAFPVIPISCTLLSCWKGAFFEPFDRIAELVPESIPGPM